MNIVLHTLKNLVVMALVMALSFNAIALGPAQAAMVPTSDLIGAVSNELTPTERRIAEEVLSEPTLLAFGTVTDLADRVGTSRPSIVRFANKLGFKGYSQLQTHVRKDLSHRLTRPSERIRHEGENTPPACLSLTTLLRILLLGEILQLDILIIFRRRRYFWFSTSAILAL